VTTTEEGAPPVTPRPPRVRRWRRLRIAGLIALSLILALAATAAGSVVWTVRRSFPELGGTVAVRGLRGAVQVGRDRWGIPQIYADDAGDLFRAQGYVHAQDRFWEMDVRRHISSGRLAEMFGGSQVEVDKVVRTMGWYRVAQRELGMLSPRTRAYLEAYADGVNAYLADHHGAELSVEYGMLRLINSGYRPQPWTPADSVSWLKALAWQLNSGLDVEVQRSLLAASLPARVVDELYPGYDYSARDPIVAARELDRAAVTPAAMAGPAGPVDAGAGARLRAAASTLRRLDAVLGPTGTGIGSNSWVLGGSRTATGKPILANDPHLAPQLPSVWYQVGLHCRSVGPACPFDVAGFGFSGMPGVVIGHNADIAWGLTDLTADVSDLYLERVEGGYYEHDGRRLPLETREETIAVAGGAPQRLTVRSTGNGPLLSGVLEPVGKVATRGAQPGHEIALRWTALQPGKTMDALFALNHAGDWRSFRAAVADLAAPAQSVVYADRAGHIGYQASGRIPLRRSGDGRTPATGWTSAHDWTGYIPFDKLPSVYDPPKGYIVTANNAATGPEYPYTISKDWGAGYRSQRIADLIKRAGKMDVEAVRRMQGDTYSANAAQLTPYLLDVPVTAEVARAQGLLRGWDFTQPPESAPAAYFNAVWRHLLRLTFTDELSTTGADPDPDGGGRWFQVIGGMLRRPDDPLWRNQADPRGLRSRDDVLRAAMTDAVGELSASHGDDPASWRWGDLHTVELRNQTLGTGAPGPVRRLLNRGPYELGGGNETVDAAAWFPSSGYEVTWAPSMRMVVDLGDLDSSRWVNQTGASGHAYHGNYVDQAALWARGETISWPFSGAAVGAMTRQRLTLVPG
jgi:penicillin amidase